MNPDQKILYLKTALAIAGIGVEKKTLDLIVQLNTLIETKQGKTDLESITEIQFNIEKKYENEPGTKK